MLLAMRLDTFPVETDTATFNVGSNDPGEQTKIRRHVLSTFESLPLEGEYVHREAFEVAERYGKDTFLAIRYLGTDRLLMMFAMKGRFDAFCERFKFLPHDICDRIMQKIASMLPKHLPKWLYDYHARFDHLILKMGGSGIKEARDYLFEIFPTDQGDYFECGNAEGEMAFLHRFAVAGGSNRYWAIHRPDASGLLALHRHAPCATTTPINRYAHATARVGNVGWIGAQGWMPSNAPLGERIPDAEATDLQRAGPSLVTSTDPCPSAAKLQIRLAVVRFRQGLV